MTFSKSLLVPIYPYATPDRSFYIWSVPTFCTSIMYKMTSSKSLSMVASWKSSQVIWKSRQVIFPSVAGRTLPPISLSHLGGAYAS